MRTQVSILLLLFLLSGCGDGKPDPRDHPNFIDTTDPNDLRMPGSPPAKPKDDAKAEK